MRSNENEGARFADKLAARLTSEKDPGARAVLDADFSIFNP